MMIAADDFDTFQQKIVYKNKVQIFKFYWTRLFVFFPNTNAIYR